MIWIIILACFVCALVFLAAPGLATGFLTYKFFFILAECLWWLTGVPRFPENWK